MAEQRRLAHHWRLRQVMAKRNLWRASDLAPLMRARGIGLSDAQLSRLISGEPERLSLKVLDALCDALECTPNDLVEQYVVARAAETANAPSSSALRRAAASVDDAPSNRISLVKDDDPA